MKEKGKGFFTEFKEFMTRGNVIDLAVAVIIGGAFQKIVNAVVADLIMPLISVVIGGIDFSHWNVKLGSGKSAPVLNFGDFISSVITFIIMGFVIFLLVKILNHIAGKVKKEEEAGEPTTKTCPYCLSEIPLKATRCPDCTSEVE